MLAQVQRHHRSGDEVSYVKCNACPSKQDCEEAGMCLNTLVTHRMGRVIPVACVGVADPALARHPIAQANAASWPTGKATPAPRPAQAPSGPTVRPAAGTATGKVWELADTHYALLYSAGSVAALNVQLAGNKAFRRQVIELCVDAGINPSTASVQFGKWLSSQS